MCSKLTHYDHGLINICGQYLNNDRLIVSHVFEDQNEKKSISCLENKSHWT